jgi:hypothetical protein
MIPSPEITDDLPFEEQLARTLGLAAQDFARDRYFPGDYVDPDHIREARRTLADLALSAVADERIQGRLALQFMESELFTQDHTVFNNRVVYHGSPYQLHVLRPAQPLWHDLDPTATYRYTDGSPAICASPNTRFPTMRALLHDAHPPVAEHTFYLGKRLDAKERTHWFTSEEVLADLTIAETRGCVYAIDRVCNVGGVKRMGGYVFLAERNEYRLTGERQPLLKASVGVDDLPGDLCVIPAEASGALSELHKYDKVRIWGAALGVPVRPLGGRWPASFAPY